MCNQCLGKKEKKLFNHQWVSLGCPRKHENEDIHQVLADSKHGVLCCSMDGEICTTNHKIENTEQRCHNSTFNEAKEICANRGGKESFRLCFPEELNNCCEDGCNQKFDNELVWIETSAIGNLYLLTINYSTRGIEKLKIVAFC